MDTSPDRRPRGDVEAVAVTPLRAESADARAALTALEAEERLARAHVGGQAVPQADEDIRLHLDVLAACDRVLRERVVAELEAALDGCPLPATSVIDSALPLLRTGVCGG